MSTMDAIFEFEVFSGGPRDLVFKGSTHFATLFLAGVSINASIFAVRKTDADLGPAIYSLRVIQFATARPGLPGDFIGSSGRGPAGEFQLLAFRTRALPEVLEARSISTR